MYIKCEKCKKEIEKNSLYCVYCSSPVHKDESNLLEKILNRDDGIIISLLSKIAKADEKITTYEERILEDIKKWQAKKYKEKNLKKIYQDIIELEQNNLKNINELCAKLLHSYDYSKADIKEIVDYAIKFAIFGKNREKLAQILSLNLHFGKEHYKEALELYMSEVISTYDLKELYCALISKTLHKDEASDKKSLENFIKIFEISDEEKKKKLEEIFYIEKNNLLDIKLICDKILEFNFLKYELAGILKIFITQTILLDNLNPKNQNILENIAKNLNFTSQEFEELLNEASALPNQDEKKDLNLQKSYEILGLKQDASNEDLINTYKKLVTEYHPDKLKQQGLNEEFINFAKQKLKYILLAFQNIKKHRGLQ